MEHETTCLYRIHPTAIVSPKSQIDPSVEIGPNVIIEPHTKIGQGTKIEANAYIGKYTTLGENNHIHMGAIIGHVPQDLSFKSETVSYVEIGNNNVIREYVTIHRGSKSESKTTLGNSNFIMCNSHLAHNVSIGNEVVIGNFTGFAGYVTVGDKAFISGGVKLHQFVSVGRLALLSFGGGFSQDIPPFVIAYDRNKMKGINLVGLRRSGMAQDAIGEIKKVYSTLYLLNHTFKEAMEILHSFSFKTKEGLELLSFISDAKRATVKREKKRSFQKESC